RPAIQRSAWVWADDMGTPLVGSTGSPARLRRKGRERRGRRAGRLLRFQVIAAEVALRGPLEPVERLGQRQGPVALARFFDQVELLEVGQRVPDAESDLQAGPAVEVGLHLFLQLLAGQPLFAVPQQAEV